MTCLSFGLPKVLKVKSDAIDARMIRTSREYRIIS